MAARKRTRDAAPAAEPAEENPFDEAYLTQLTELSQTCSEQIEAMEESDAIKSVSQEEKDALVSEMIRHIVFKNHSKPGCPIAQSELTEIVTKKQVRAKKGLSAYIIRCAHSKMLEIFGMELRQITRMPAATAKGSSKNVTERTGTPWYILRSTLPDSYRQRLVQVPMRKESFNGFAMTVLCCIELSGEGILEEELWRMLNSLGVDSKKEHDTLGYAADLLKKMESMRYIAKEKVPSQDGETCKYRLAENALDEIGKENIHAFMREITGEAEED